MRARSVIFVATALAISAGCAESTGPEWEIGYSGEGTELLPVDGGGLGYSSPNHSPVGWWKLAYVNGQPVPAADPFLPWRTQGGQITGATIYISGPSAYLGNYFRTCRTTTQSFENFRYNQTANSITFYLTTLIPEYGDMVNAYTLDFRPYTGTDPAVTYTFTRSNGYDLNC